VRAWLKNTEASRLVQSLLGGATRARPLLLRYFAACLGADAARHDATGFTHTRIEERNAITSV